MGARRALGVITCLALAGCATSGVGTSRPTVSLAEELGTELARQDARQWVGARPLAWSDFRGMPPSDGPEGARTAYILTYGMRCHGQAFQFLVIAALLPQESWVKPRVLADSAENRRTLRHEQTHFNLTEVYARRMRKYFAEFINPCVAPADQLKTSAERLVRDEGAAQALYDLETQHGLAPTRQRAWDTDVSEMLASLKKYERP